MYKWFSALLNPGAAVAPSNVSAVVESSTVIRVRWNGLSPCVKVNGFIVYYRVQYTAESSNVTQSIDHPGDWNVTGAEVLLTGLTPFTKYSIQVAAVNKQGDIGLYSHPRIEQTWEDSECLCIICVCVLRFQVTLRWFVRRRNNSATNCSADNKNQLKCRVFSENASLLRFVCHPHSTHTNSRPFIAENVHAHCPSTVGWPAN